VTLIEAPLTSFDLKISISSFIDFSNEIFKLKTTLVIKSGSFHPFGMKQSPPERASSLGYQKEERREA